MQKHYKTQPAFLHIFKSSKHELIPGTTTASHQKKNSFLIQVLQIPGCSRFKSFGDAQVFGGVHTP
jgi:hypothetical protein